MTESAEQYLKEFIGDYRKFEEFNTTALHLSAAENVMSPFVKLPLASSIQEKYIMGGIEKYASNNNFIGSKYLFPFYSLIKKLGKDLFSANYTDARALSGMNALTVVLMSAFNAKDRILISDGSVGGHSSLPLVAARLGIKVEPLPFDQSKQDFDYDKTNELLATEKYAGVVVALSDMLKAPKLDNLQLNGKILVYDATHLLGLIGAGLSFNPLTYFNQEEKVLLIGATHKTIPGPSSGIIMTNNNDLIDMIDKKINPAYLRNVQMQQVLSVLLVLIELKKYGVRYGKQIIWTSNTLGKNLNEYFDVLKINSSTFSETHQVHLSIPSDDKLTNFMRNAALYGVTLNRRDKIIYKPRGVRLGTQQIARYLYDEADLKMLSEILFTMYEDDSTAFNKELQFKVDKLSQKQDIHFALPVTQNLLNIMED